MTKPSKSILIGERVRIYPRGKKKTYCADFWYDGRHQRRSLKTRNLKVARQRAIQLEAQLIEGDLKPSQTPISLEKTVEAFLEHIKTENRRPKTITKYKGFFEVFREFAESNNVYRLSQVTPALVDKYRAFRKADLSMKSMHNEAVMLKTLLRWAKQRWYIRENPLAEMKFERPRLEPRGGPTRAQVEGILKKAREPRRTQYAVLAYTGMRSGELQRLRVEDLDLKGNWIHVVSREGAETKTGYSREVPIHPNLKPFLEKLSRSGPWLFNAPPSRKYPQGGHWINTKHLNEDFQRLLAATGVPAGRKKGGFSIHSLRNSFETICVNAGIPQRVVDTWLGHRSDRSMASVYYKLSDEDSQKFMLKVPLGTGQPAGDAGNT
ncbi:MAG: tyrosine-type recombinase/integrase [Planctomycetota bacterium]